MKTKTRLTFLCVLFFQVSLFSQYSIVGENWLCFGDCGQYILVDDTGNQVDDVTWEINGQIFIGSDFIYCDFGEGILTASINGVIVAEFYILVDCCNPEVVISGNPCVGECVEITISGGWPPYWIDLSNGQQIPGSTWCPDFPGTYQIFVTDANGCTTTATVTVTEIGTPDIFSLSGAFCLNDSLTNCDRVCENTTVTYVTEVGSPNSNITWSVSGAESWTANDNEVTVEWGDPGQGQVSVFVGNGGPSGDLQIYCNQIGPVDPNTGLAAVNIFAQGSTPPPYTVEVNGNVVDYFGPGNLEIGLGVGDYNIVVYDDFGNSATCETTVEAQTCGPMFIVNFDSADGLCDFCEASITLEESPYVNGNPPYTYLWSDAPAQTTQNVFGLCEGFYSVTITDAEGCETVYDHIPIQCSQTTSGCSGSNSLCVDILEVPEAAFSTNPPAVNGVVEICEGQTVFFDNLTEGGFNYTWDFGNGVSSSLVDAEHTYLSAGTYEAYLIARNDCFCGDSTSVTIVVEESITPEIDCAGTICPGEEITYTTNADCSVFYWTVSNNGTIISGGGLSDDFITVDWGAGPIGLIELSVDGCNGDYCVEPLFETIPIIDDNAEIEGPSRVCKGQEVIYSMPPYAGTEFNWGVSNFGTITDGQGTNEITVQWADIVTAQQQMVTVDYESCYLGCGGQDTLLVKILNEIFIEGPILVCPNEQATYTCRTPLGNNAPANWTVYSPIGTVVATSGAATADFDVNWNFVSGNYIVEAEVANPQSYCVDNFSVFVEIVPPTDLPSSIDGELEICPGTSYSYTANSATSGYDYTWYVSDGGSNYILNGKTVNIIWGASPPYTLALTQTNLDGFACESESIEANPAVISNVDLIGSPEVCNESSAIYTATSYVDLQYSWTVIPSDAGSIIAGENSNQVEVQWHLAGNFNLQVSVCGASDMIPVTVHALPNPVPVYGDVCPGQTGPVSVAGLYTAYEWRDENGGFISSAPNINVGSGYYEVIVTDDNGCVGNETFYVGTFGQPDVTISTPDFGNFCANGGSMTLYALESSSGPLDYQWFWNGTPFGNNSSSQVVTNEGTYQVVVTDINGCTANSNTLGLSCASLPGGGMPGCTPGGTVSFEIAQGAYCNESIYTNTSFNDVPGFYSWEFWDIVGGGISYSSQENPMHTWTNAGFNIVVFQAGVNSIPPGQVCLMEVFQFDTIPLAANFVYEGICVGDMVSFEDISTYIPQTSISSWSWNFGDPASGALNTSDLQNPTHIYNTGGSYTVVLTVTDQSGCISEHSEIVQILDPPLTSFTIPQISCEGASLFFEADGDFTDVTWDFGDPASGAANTSTVDETYHVYTTPGVYTVTLSVENVYGCSETVSDQVTIEANDLNGTILVNPGMEVCEGDSVILRAPMADSYAWSTGAVGQEITVFTAGNYDVTIYDAVGCGYTPPPVVIDIIPLPQGQISAVEYNEFDQPVEFYYNNYETCYGDDVFLEITNNPNYTYQWSTGETTTDISFTEEKDNLLEVGTHEFEVTITDTNTGCTNVVGPFTVTVHPIPENIIIISMPAMPVCENTPTQISVFNPDPNYVYIWNTGEVGTSINTFYAGEYFVRAINQFGCEGESNTLEIVPGPNVDLIPSGCHARCNPDTICLPAFNDVATFQWYFNGAPIPAPDGTIPDYVATESGEYYVEMISYAGCVTVSDVLTLDLYDGFGTIQGNVWFDMNENGIIDGADTLMNNIPIILQNGTGTPLDTLFSNQNGSFAFNNILSTDYGLVVDTLNLPGGMIAIISQVSTQLVGCDDEEMVEFLIQFICPPISSTVELGACLGEMADYNGTQLGVGESQDFNFLTPLGCDSVVTVTVVEIPASTGTLALEACPGSTVNYEGVDLSPGMTQDFVLENAAGCDSTVTVTVNALLESTGTLALEACPGSTVNYEGIDLSPGMIQDFVLENAAGCDSTVTVTVNALLESSNAVSLTTCAGSTVSYNGEDLPGGTVQDFIFENSVGCDSTVTVTVIESDQDSSSIQLLTCPGTMVEYDGTMLGIGSQTDFTFNGSGGCDSIVTVIIEPYQTYAEVETFEACTGTTVNYNGTTLNPGTSTEFTFSTINNCDSIVTVVVTELFESTNTIELPTCENSTVFYNGTELSPGTSTAFTFENAVGCDSVVTVDVPSLAISLETIELEACEGGTTTYNGNSLGAGTVTEFTFENALGCDSVVTVEVAALPLFDEELNLSACEGGTVEYNGEDLPAGFFGQFTFVSSGGCDSVVTVTVEEVAESFYTLNVSACEGETYGYNGQNIPAGSTEIFTFTNAGGCDSTVTVNVANLQLSESFVDLFVCQGEDIEYNGSVLSAGFEDTFILTDQNGCDSTVMVSVLAFPEFEFDLSTDASCWNEQNGNLYVENVSGGVGPFEYSLDGVNYQDSTSFTNLDEGSFEVFVRDGNGCIENQMIEVDEIQPIVVNANVPEIPCDFSPVRLELDINTNEAGPVAITWENGSVQPIIYVDTAGVYTVSISNACESFEESFNVPLAADARENFFYVPNVFSPNNDGMNDLWRIMPPDDMEVLNFELHVFDRWGNHMKTFAGIDDFWDGRFKDEMMDPGVYVYWFKATVISCGRTLEVYDEGDVTVVK